MLTTNSDALADRVRALRGHGGARKYYHEELGVNSRLDELQAAILLVKLPRLDSWIERRRRLAVRYNEAFAGTDIIAPPEQQGYRHVYHQYTVRVARRDDVRGSLLGAGVQTMVYYPVPLHLQKVHAALGLRPGAFPHAEAAAESVLSLPMYPELDEAAQDRVIEALRTHAMAGAAV
jgi:dTDP-4-amino-4,6-dideoxygalactose transaminase